MAETRFHFVGDEYIYAEISREMSTISAFKALSITRELRRQKILGIIDICPANTSYLIRYNPEIIPPYNLLDYLREIDSIKNNPAALNLKVHIVEIPIWYNDPITNEYAQQFKERTQHNCASDFEFVMKRMGFKEEKGIFFPFVLLNKECVRTYV
ncbi:carboxyltransferase domain-containing protein [Aneurinibacillus tyrosinisolvens]|uniref:carboxyltransferase domain-containing protein n=1 Tax=Aneurinibacillus tyrosinisolvens TaxID=1443435 RepID=UPI000699C5AB|nr:carboxyltransferase domain-containing protein [Aneurinibacillus tyrosinisolvens]